MLRVAGYSSARTCRRSFASSSRVRIPAKPDSSGAPTTESSSTTTIKDDSPPAETATPGPEPSDVRVFNLSERLRELSENSAIAMRKRADEFTASAMIAFSRLGGQLNHVTGYDEIDALKRRVKGQEERIEQARRAAREAKTAYDDAVSRRAQSQKDVNDLLQRKSFWKDDDVGRFTTLVREDHIYEQEETRAKDSLDRADATVEREFSTLMRSILDRYHEEQVWSDKIRSASTYGSLAALGLNLLVFIMAIIIVEPWKRRRLAQTFERKVEEMGSQTRAMFESGMKELEDHLEEQEKRLVQVAAAAVAASNADVPVSSEQPLPPPSDEADPSTLPTPRLSQSPTPTLDYTLLATGFVAVVVGWTARSFWSH